MTMLAYWSSCSRPEPRKQRCSPPSTAARFTLAQSRSAAVEKSSGEISSCVEGNMNNFNHLLDGVIGFNRQEPIQCDQGGIHLHILTESLNFLEASYSDHQLLQWF